MTWPEEHRNRGNDLRHAEKMLRKLKINIIVEKSQLLRGRYIDHRPPTCTLDVICSHTAPFWRVPSFASIG